MRRRRFIIGLVVLIGLTALWFLGVDKSWFVEGCEDCLYDRDVMQYRVFTVPIYQRAFEHHSPIELVARDLGAPCPHQAFSRWHKYRWWGLCYVAQPMISGITRLSGGEPWYDEQISAKVKAAAAADPTLGQKFSRRVLYGHDWNYWHRFMRELRDDGLEQVVLLGSNLPEEKLQEIVNRTELIEWLESKSCRPQPDENAAIVLALGERAGPHLVEKITDERPSPWLTWATVGDVAHLVLSAIYNKNWPGGEFVETHQLKWNESYSSYHRKFLRAADTQQNRENRKKLQQAWKRLVEKEEE